MKWLDWLVDNWGFVAMVLVIVGAIVLALFSDDAESTLRIEVHIHSAPTEAAVEAVDPHNCYEEGPLECPCAPELGEDD